VIVEGHAIGRLDGFTLPDAAEAGSDAKALQAAGAKVLAGEIDARAEKLAAAPTISFVLASAHHPLDRDAGSKARRGRRCAASAAFASSPTIAERRARARRSDAPRFVAEDAYRKAVGPLFACRKPRTSPVSACIAFQLVEASALLERTKISAEMKDLDRLRAHAAQYGVASAPITSISGAPEARRRARGVVLWPRSRTMSICRPCRRAASGEFGPHSFPVDKALPRDAYRLLAIASVASAQCGSISWNVSPTDPACVVLARVLARRKAAGAFDGRSFVVPQG